MERIKEKLQAEGGAGRIYISSDIVACVLLRMPAKYVARLRCVCRRWRSLTRDHGFIDEHRRLWAFERRNIVSLEWRPELRLWMHEVGPNYDEFKSRRIELNGEESNPDIFMSGALSNPVNGLIATFCRPTLFPLDIQPYLINPTTRDRLEIPWGRRQLGRHDRQPGIGLGFDASRGVYKLVSFQAIADGGMSCSCMVLTVGDGGWRFVERHAPFAVESCDSRPVFVDGAIYWLVVGLGNAVESYSWSILAFNVKDEKYRLIPSPGTHVPHMNLQELEGRVCLVKSTVDPELTTMRVWKLEGRPNHEHWKLEYEFHIPDWSRETICYTPKFVDVRVGKAILVAFDGILSYDLHNKTLHRLCRYKRFLYSYSSVITESLLSPRTLFEEMYACGDAEAAADWRLVMSSGLAFAGPQSSRIDSSTPSFSSADPKYMNSGCNEAMQVQMELQRRLHEQLED